MLVRRRARRKLYLDPLLEMTLSALIFAIDDMPIRRAKAVLHAMDTCNQTNCGWAEYQLAKRFRDDVIARIAMLKERQK